MRSSSSPFARHLETAASDVEGPIRNLAPANGESGVREVPACRVPKIDLDARTRDEEREWRETPIARSFGGMIGASPAMRAVYSVLERVAPTTASVLVTGESGTGKELAARAIHMRSERANKPFEVVDCGRLPTTLIESELFGHERGAFTGANSEREGAFERADGGTLFLDELGELPLDVQPKLLRVLGEGEVRRVGGKCTRKVDVRVVAATNRDLRREIGLGRFRRDLYYRIAVFEVRLPALRERLDDLPALVTALLDRIQRDRRVTDRIDLDARFWEPVARYAWPGNVRELRNYLERLLILGVAPALEDASDAATVQNRAIVDGLHGLPWHTAKSELLARFERQYVSSLLEETDGNIAEAARRAGVDRSTFFRTIRKLGIRRDEEE